MATYMYVLLCDGAEWEDIKIYDNFEDAKNELSHIKNTKKHVFVQNYRIEFFEKKVGTNCFVPTYKNILP
uniref:Uncharacterized protein n=1 Tax=viral metagenome TaxID=1070528 RepID=A0A6C0E307_9ZZZZ